MTTPQDTALANLRRSIDALPERTRRAMLSGLASNTVITGAFSDGTGVCPMLAAHREGDRVRCMSFPEAWDRFTGVHGRCITRPASKGEVLQLQLQLEESLDARAGAGGGTGEFAAAIAEHEATVAANREHAAAQAQAAAHEAVVAAREAQREAERKDEERRERRRRESGGFVADFAGAINEHLAIARERRGREATQTGLDWLFEETLVLPEDFDRDLAPDAEHDEEFDFSREPVTVVPPARPRGRSILK